MNLGDFLMLLGGLAVALVLAWAVRGRRRSHARDARELAEAETCAHLKPALEVLLARGHVVRRVGQKAPEMPLEVHLEPAFDPRVVYEELRLAEPVFVSERNVLYCKEDWCELHPPAR
jgi:hypothetical protein